MPAKPDVPLVPIETLDQLHQAIAHRRAELEFRDAADAQVKTENLRLQAYLSAAGVKRFQLADGSVLQVVEPAPRLTVDPVLLLQNGVDPAIIEASTVSKAVSPYVKVDSPRGVASPVEELGRKSAVVRDIN